MTHPIRAEINRLEAHIEGYQDSIKNIRKKIARISKDLREDPDRLPSKAHRASKEPT